MALVGAWATAAHHQRAPALPSPGNRGVQRPRHRWRPAAAGMPPTSGVAVCVGDLLRPHSPAAAAHSRQSPKAEQWTEANRAVMAERCAAKAESNPKNLLRKL